MTNILAAFEDLGDYLGAAWELATGNALICIFLAATLLGVGVGIFRKLKKV